MSVANDTAASAIRLTPDILKKGETILGMTGTLEIGVDTTDANATADDMAELKTAYVKGVKLIGTIPEIKTDETTTSTQIKFENGIVITADNKLILNEGAGISVDANTSTSSLGITNDKILYGKTICGVSGQATFIESNYAVESNILTGKKAYVNGKLVTGKATTSYNQITSKDKIIVNDTTFEVKPFTTSTFIEDASKTIKINNSALADAIELTPEMLQKDIKVLGVTGTYVGEAGTGTEDATAEAKDIVNGKTAYINKVKVTGTLPTKENTTIKSKQGTLTKITNTNGTSTYQVTIPDLKTYTDGVMIKNSDITLILSESTLASVIDLTSDMIAEGTTVLGIAGTHAGNGMLTEEEYNEIEAIADNILAIETQEASEEEYNEIENNGGEE